VADQYFMPRSRDGRFPPDMLCIMPKKQNFSPLQYLLQATINIRVSLVQRSSLTAALKSNCTHACKCMSGTLGGTLVASLLSIRLHSTIVTILQNITAISLATSCPTVIENRFMRIHLFGEKFTMRTPSS